MPVADKRRTNWFWMYNAIIDDYGPDLGAIGLAVYTALARHANAAGESWPSVGTIALEIKTSESSVHRALKQLASEPVKLISITRQLNPAGDATSNLYTLLNIRQRQAANDDAGGDTSSLNAGLLNTCSPLGVTLTPPPGVSVTPGGVSVTPPPPDLWRKTLDQLRLQMTKGTYEAWLRGTTAERADNTLTVYVPSTHAKDWLHMRLRSVVERTVASIYEAPLTVTFEVRQPTQLSLTEA